MKLHEFVRVSQLKAGDIVRDHGARFAVIADAIRCADRDGIYHRANGAFIDGEITLGYIGPGKEWTFQGNELFNVFREITLPKWAANWRDAEMQLKDNTGERWVCFCHNGRVFTGHCQNDAELSRARFYNLTQYNPYGR